MYVWLEALLVALAAIILIIIVLCIVIRHRLRLKQKSIVTSVGEPKTESFQPVNRRLSYFRRGSSVKPVFNWADHPSLITDAVENGWSRFAFTNYTPSPSVRSSVFGSVRVTGDHYPNSYQVVDLSWEVGQGSVDFMQKITFRKINGSQSSTSGKSTVRMGLPLPGPPSYFPQEAYFEITVLSNSEDDGKSTARIKSEEEEKAKLIDQNISSSSNKKGVIMKNESGVQLTEMESIKKEAPKMALGLGGGESWMTGKSPGRYKGSIGFNSNGSVFLAGMKLVFEDDEKHDWAQKGKVIGCGFDPRIRKVFFTIDSKLVRVIHCKSEDFGMPLYPILTANTDITILVNLGQSPFMYSPANAHRTPNPCFIGPTINSSTPNFGYEDSRELFSMERMDVGWLSHNGTIKSTISNSSNHTINKSNCKTSECDEELDSDLFEIPLDRTRSSIIV